MPNTNVWERVTFDFLDSVASRIEGKNGRMTSTVVTKADFDVKKEQLYKRIDEGNHFRYKKSYLYEIFS